MNKKFHVLLLTVVLTGHYAQAQFSFGVRAGFNYTNFYDSEGCKFKPGFQAGVVGDLSVAPAFSIQPAILFATQGCKTEYSNLASSSSDATTTLNYIQVPVHFQYKVDLSGPKLFVQAGPFFGYGLGGKTKAGSNSVDIKMGGDENLKAIDYGVSGGVGVQFGHIQVGVGYLLGLADINNTDFGHSVKNTGLSLALTYLF